MNFYNVLFFNQSIDFKYKKHKVLKESKNFVWLENDRKEKIKVSKKTQRVWVINESVIYETAKCNILEPVA
jgi:hypothetical protein